MTSPHLLRGVDLAAFAVALVDRLRGAGVAVSAVGSAGLVEAMHVLAPARRSQLYWAARLTLVSRVDDLAAFDAVFHAVFDDAVLGLDPVSVKRPLDPALSPAGRPTADAPSAGDGDGLPWTTRLASVSAATHPPTGSAVPELLPSRLVAQADTPFEQFDSDELRRIGAWLESAQTRWPRRRTLRRQRHPAGRHVDLRATIKASRTTGWEPLRVARTRRQVRPRRVVLVCDVSGSMQPYATVYLHLMRATALRSSGLRPEVFAFATTLTRLTAALSHRCAETALARANDKVIDRYGGTHLGRSIGTLLALPHGNALRGAVVVIASDGWDADGPDTLRRAMSRLRRRAHLVIWLNPRAAAPGFAPLTGSMAAALPFCDHFLPAHTLAGLRELFDVLG
ncbi:VWA containing CoxE family protein [Mycobacterium dioxanotrophicus]|uniref:VWA containing CoxE family protein n=1 Tax=Mycobacterium dioxanotrophicus TaxID=482462 RepID=A0A1Y0CC61_9MYCO|nr:VWA domain-containing protein [Mycobacterium dioxanotrophicus]ART72616.1 VWA containing CoxE family protein [Mycobacterium dioxanotrophicus]